MSRILIFITSLAAIAAGPTQSFALSANCFAWTNTVGLTGVTPAPATVDANLVDPWGLAFFPGEPFRISDHGSGISTTYDGSAVPAILSPVVSIPQGVSSSLPGASPTGIVANLTTAFVNPVTHNPTTFIFATQDGVIAGWNSLDGTNATKIVDNSASGAVYYGLAMGNAVGKNVAGMFLYAPNFHTGAIDVFDTNFSPVTNLDGTFSDRTLPSGFAPFNVVNIRGNLFVTYAQQDSAKATFVAGKNLGYVDVFDTDGKLIKRFASKNKLNAPWGIAEAPLNFGSFGGDILVGNFGDGTIDGFDPVKGANKGQLTDAATKKPIVIAGLWALVFGGAQNSDPATLYYTARFSETMTSGGLGAITAQTAAQCAVGGAPY
jgi:uncharacterized protein (TIGR03118 family)